MGPKVRGRSAAARGSQGQGRGRRRRAGSPVKDDLAPVGPMPASRKRIIQSPYFMAALFIITSLCARVVGWLVLGGGFHRVFGDPVAQQAMSVSTVTLTTTMPGMATIPTLALATEVDPGFMPSDKGRQSRHGPPRRFHEMCAVTLRWAWGGHGPGDRSLYDIMGVSPVVCPSPSSPPSKCPPLFSHTGEGSALFGETLQQAFYKRTEGLNFACRVGLAKEADGRAPDSSASGGGDTMLVDDGLDDGLDEWTTTDKVSAVCPSLLLARSKREADRTGTKCAKATLITRAFRLLLDRASREVYDLEFLPGVAKVEVHEDVDAGEAWMRRVEEFCGVVDE